MYNICMNQSNLITTIVSSLIIACAIYFIVITFDITHTFNIHMLSFIFKRILTGICIGLQIILCIVISGMIILQKSDDGVFKRSLNPLMSKADNVALHNNTKWFILAIVINSLLIQFIW